MKNEFRFGHAVTRDFWAWQDQSPAMDVRFGLWEHDRVWAPHIIEVDGIYYMFYTGVNVDSLSGTYVQSIGLATSSDLYVWNRQPHPIYTCASAPWTFCDSSLSLGGDFRDPFVMPNPVGPGYLMYYATRQLTPPQNMGGGLAASTDLSTWQDEGLIGVTDESQSNSVVAESPHVFSHNGVYYLVWTTNGGQPLCYATSDNPLGGWTYRGRLGAMLGLDTTTWFASEHFNDGLVDYFAFDNYDRVDVRRIVWSEVSDSFKVVQPDTFHVYLMTWSQNPAPLGSQIQIYVGAVGCMGRTAGLELLQVDDNGGMTRLDNSSYGLPDAITFTSHMQILNWWVVNTNQQALQPQFLLRLSDQSCQTAVLATLPPAGSSPPDGRRRESGSDDGLVQFRLLSKTPLPGRAALAIDMPRAGRARVDVFDLAGRRLRTLLDEDLPAGARVVTMGEGALPTRGLYFARLITPWSSRTVRLPWFP